MNPDAIAAEQWVELLSVAGVAVIVRAGAEQIDRHGSDWQTLCGLEQKVRRLRNHLTAEKSEPQGTRPRGTAGPAPETGERRMIDAV